MPKTPHNPGNLTFGVVLFDQALGVLARVDARGDLFVTRRQLGRALVSDARRSQNRRLEVLERVTPGRAANDVVISGVARRGHRRRSGGCVRDAEVGSGDFAGAHRFVHRVAEVAFVARGAAAD